jgi:YHS domain-containing protein
MLATRGFTLATVLGMLIIPTLTLSAHAQDGLRWERSLESARQMAAASNRLLLLHFWDEGCPPCQRLEQQVFSNPNFGQALSAHYVAVKVKMSDNPAVVKQYGIDRMPMDVVATPRGQALFKSVSPQDGTQYVGQLMQAAFNAQRTVQQAALPNETSMNIGNPAATMPPPMTSADLNAAPTYNTAPPSSAQIPSNSLPTDSVPANAPAASSAPSSSLPSSNSLPPSKSTTTDDRYADYYARRQAVSQDPAGPAASSAPATAWTPPSNNPPPMASSSPPLNNPPSAQTSESRYATQAPATAPYMAPTNPPPSNSIDQPNVAWAPPTPPPPYGNQPVATGPANPYAGLGAPAQNSFASQQPLAQQPVAQPNPSNPPFAGSPYANQTVASPPMQGLPQIPQGSPPLGLEGYCPVSLAEKRSWTRGNSQWGAIHRGRTYLFISQAEQQKFLANPDMYSPMLSGNDPVLQLQQNQAVPGRREHGVFYNNRIYLFANEATLKEFTQAPNRYDAMIIQAMLPPPR